MCVGVAAGLRFIYIYMIWVFFWATPWGCQSRAHRDMCVWRCGRINAVRLTWGTAVVCACFILLGTYAIELVVLQAHLTNKKAIYTPLSLGFVRVAVLPNYLFLKRNISSHLNDDSLHSHMMQVL